MHKTELPSRRTSSDSALPLGTGQESTRGYSPSSASACRMIAPTGLGPWPSSVKIGAITSMCGGRSSGPA